MHLSTVAYVTAINEGALPTISTAWQVRSGPRRKPEAESSSS